MAQQGRVGKVEGLQNQLKLNGLHFEAFEQLSFGLVHAKLVDFVRQVKRVVVEAVRRNVFDKDIKCHVFDDGGGELVKEKEQLFALSAKRVGLDSFRHCAKQQLLWILPKLLFLLNIVRNFNKYGIVDMRKPMRKPINQWNKDAAHHNSKP